MWDLPGPETEPVYSALAGEFLTTEPPRKPVYSGILSCKIKSYLLSNIPIEGNFNYKFTSCLCNSYPRRFFWDLQTNSKYRRLTAVVDVVRQLNICPDDWAVIPIKANRFFITKSLP
uniref:Prolactin-induced protein n=1 Tax=Moschus moschiferus TaxID=68415 RepID=A0A8C6CGF5_MOSMO